MNGFPWLIVAGGIPLLGAVVLALVPSLPAGSAPGDVAARNRLAKLIALALPLIAARVAVALTVVPYMFLFVATQSISDYVSYRDIFHAEEAAGHAA